MSELAEGAERARFKIVEIQVDGKMFKIEIGHQDDGGFIADAIDVPGAMLAYGETEEKALQGIQQLIKKALDSGSLRVRPLGIGI